MKKTYLCSSSHTKCSNNKYKCCFCQDKRSYLPEGMYSGYLDGIGLVMNKNRWDFYCPSCKSHFDKI